MEIALAFGLAGMAFFGAIGVITAASPEPKFQNGWKEAARRHLPYRTLGRKDIESVSGREDFERAVIESAVRHHQGKPGSHTANMLKRVIEKDTERSAGGILLPQEIMELSGISQHVIMGIWKTQGRKPA